MAKRRELWANLVAPQFGGPVVSMSVPQTMSGADDLMLFVATRDMRIRRAWVSHTVAPTGTGTYALHNLSTTTDISSADIDADALATDTPAQFSLVSDHTVYEGELVVLEVAGTGGGPLVVTMEVEYLEYKND